MSKATAEDNLVQCKLKNKYIRQLLLATVPLETTMSMNALNFLACRVIVSRVIQCCRIELTV